MISMASLLNWLTFSFLFNAIISSLVMQTLKGSYRHVSTPSSCIFCQNISEINLMLSENLNMCKKNDTYLCLFCITGNLMALKFMQKNITELRVFLIEYCLSLSLSTHPCIINTFGIAFQTERHYVFAQELANDNLFSLMKPQVNRDLTRDKSCFSFMLCKSLEYSSLA